MGQVRIDGVLAEAGRTLEIRRNADDSICGFATVQQLAAYVTELSTSCFESEVLTAQLPDEDLTTVFTPPRDGAPVANLTFEAAPEQEVVSGATDRAEALLNSSQTRMILLSILALVLLLCVAYLVVLPLVRRSTLKSILDKAQPRTQELAVVRAAIESQHRPDFRVVVEVVLLAVVAVALVTLTLGGTITEQGAVSILGAIVGYVAGRASSGSSG